MTHRTYRSNLACPDPTPCFTHAAARHGAHGHTVLFDGDLHPWCNYMTHDEAAILWHAVRNQRMNNNKPLQWADLGSYSGWSTVHIAAHAAVHSVDHAYLYPNLYGSKATAEDFAGRYNENIKAAGYGSDHCRMYGNTTDEFFRLMGQTRGELDGAMIDANHDGDAPLQDALNAMIAGCGVLVFHDLVGEPVRRAVRELVRRGWRARVYKTPQIVAVCAVEGGYQFPEHTPDPQIDWAAYARQVEDPKVFDIGAGT